MHFAVKLIPLTMKRGKEGGMEEGRERERERERDWDCGGARESDGRVRVQCTEANVPMQMLTIGFNDCVVITPQLNVHSNWQCMCVIIIGSYEGWQPFIPMCTFWKEIKIGHKCQYPDSVYCAKYLEHQILITGWGHYCQQEGPSHAAWKQMGVQAADRHFSSSSFDFFYLAHVVVGTAKRELLFLHMLRHVCYQQVNK